MIVELVGAPGSGKTTLAVALCRRLGDVGVRALPTGAARRRARRRLRWPRAALAGAALAFILGHPRLVLRVAAGQACRRAPWPQRVVTLRRFLRDAAVHRLLRQTLRAGEAAVLCEGLVQRVIGLHVSVTERARPQAVSRYVAALPAIDGLVLLRAPVALCTRRIGARGLPRRLRGRSPAEVTRFVAHAAEAAELAAAACVARGTPVLSASTAGALDGCLTALTPRLARLRPRPAGAEMP
jgi:hypothetical protein